MEVEGTGNQVIVRRLNFNELKIGRGGRLSIIDHREVAEE